MHIQTGDRVRVVKLDSTTGMLIADRHLQARRVGATGIVRNYVPGHGGDVWFVEHDDGSIGAYLYIGDAETDEIERL